MEAAGPPRFSANGPNVRAGHGGSGRAPKRGRTGAGGAAVGRREGAASRWEHRRNIRDGRPDCKCPAGARRRHLAARPSRFARRRPGSRPGQAPARKRGAKEDRRRAIRPAADLLRSLFWTGYVLLFDLAGAAGRAPAASPLRGGRRQRGGGWRQYGAGGRRRRTSRWRAARQRSPPLSSATASSTARPILRASAARSGAGRRSSALSARL